jgi:hypothetical protein
LLARAVDPSPRRVGRRGAAVNVMATPHPGQCGACRPPDPPQPVELRRQRPGAVLQVLQVAVAVERPAVSAARLAAPVAGLRGAWTGSSGLGQQVQLRPLSIPDPGWMLISLGRRVFWRVTRRHRPWLVAKLRPPQLSVSRRARPSRSRMARSPYSPTVGPAGQGLGPDHATHAGVTAAGSSALAGVVAKPVDRPRRPLDPRRGTAAWHTHVAAVVLDEKVPVDLARKR